MLALLRQVPAALRVRAAAAIIDGAHIAEGGPDSNCAEMWFPFMSHSNGEEQGQHGFVRVLSAIVCLIQPGSSMQKALVDTNTA